MTPAAASRSGKAPAATEIFEPGHQRFRTPRLAADGRQLRVAVGDDAAVPADDLGKEQRERRPVRHAVSAAHRPGTGMDRTERRMPGGGACEKPSEEGGAHRLGVVRSIQQAGNTGSELPPGLARAPVRHHRAPRAHPRLDCARGRIEHRARERVARDASRQFVIEYDDICQPLLAGRMRRWWYSGTGKNRHVDREPRRQVRHRLQLGLGAEGQDEIGGLVVVDDCETSVPEDRNNSRLSARCVAPGDHQNATHSQFSCERTEPVYGTRSADDAGRKTKVERTHKDRRRR